jgi:predicted DNA-binding transcriptional regulator YafY
MRVDRLISIIMVLLNCEKMSAAKLAALFEVSPRTIYRDVEALEQAGIPIFATAGAEGGIGILPEYKVDKCLFSAAEVQTLLMGLNSVSTVVSREDIAGTLEKVRRLLPDKKGVRADQVTVDLTAWMGNKGLLAVIGLIKRALGENRVVRFSYYNRMGERSVRQVEPYQLVLKGANWYMHGYCLHSGDFRVFKLARVSRLSLAEETFVPREFSAKPLDGSGWVERRLITIQLLVDCSLYERMMELCGEERITAAGDGQFLVDFPFVPDEFGYNLLLGFGDKCECVGPAEVREELARRVRRMASLYKL